MDEFLRNLSERRRGVGDEWTRITNVDPNEDPQACAFVFRAMEEEIQEAMCLRTANLITNGEMNDSDGDDLEMMECDATMPGQYPGSRSLLKDQQGI